MHRVELKAQEAQLFCSLATGSVPNAPCGVEREVSLQRLLRDSGVPNAPCGVERTICLL